MNFVKRAMCYVRRKSGKSVLLFFLFLVADITILGTLAILDTSSGINDEIRRQTNAKVVIESLEVNRSLTEQDYLKLLDITGINSMNRMAKCTLNPNGFAPITGADESEIGQVCLIGFDDMEKDSPFTENVCRLVAGEFAKNENEIVINQHLAEQNQIEIGDELHFIPTSNEPSGHGDGSARVTGFYLNGNERKQTENVLTINRIENQIYTNLSFAVGMGAERYEKIVAYVNNPEQLSETADVIGTTLGEGFGISTQDTMYQKMKFSIMQIERVTKLVFGLTVMTSIFVAGMLLCMWMRNRKVEIAVFVSLGISKLEVFLQMMTEIVCIYSISCMMSAGIFSAIIPFLSELMKGMDGVRMNLTFSMRNVWKVWGIGVIVLTLITLMVMLPCLTKKIKDTLSEMEG